MPDNEIPPVKLDGRRAFRGRSQLTDREQALLNEIEQAGLRVAFEKSGPSYWCGKLKVDTNTALRLISRNYLVPNDRGLFAGASAQCWRVRLGNARDPPF